MIFALGLENQNLIDEINATTERANREF